MILCADVPAELRDLDDLDQAGVGVLANALHARFLEAGAVVAVELEAVAVTLADVE